MGKTGVFVPLCPQEGRLVSEKIVSYRGESAVSKARGRGRGFS